MISRMHRYFFVAMPPDQSTRDYLIYVLKQLEYQTNKYQYNGNLAVDAKRLGISLEDLNDVLKSKLSVTSTAQELFKKLVPSHQRQVENWNELDEDVRTKEKILIGTADHHFVHSDASSNLLPFRFS